MKKYFLIFLLNFYLSFSQIPQIDSNKNDYVKTNKRQEYQQQRRKLQQQQKNNVELTQEQLQQKQQQLDQRRLDIQQGINDRHQKLKEQITSDEKILMQKVESQFQYVLWGRDHHYHSHWVQQLSNHGQNGIQYSDKFRKYCIGVDIELKNFEQFGINYKEATYHTGDISFHEHVPEHNLYYGQRWKSYVAINKISKENMSTQDYSNTDL